jgi:hypothetical protein
MEVKTSKPKLIRLLITSLVFVVLGLWMIIKPADENSLNPLFRSKIFVTIIGASCILFFGLGFIIFLLKLLGFKKYKLIIDDTGITDNSNKGSIGHIPWSDIKEVKINSVVNQKFLTIVVNNPDDYINKQRTLAKRKGMQADFNRTGSPINISTKVLSTKLDKLKATIETKLTEYRTKTNK